MTHDRHKGVCALLQTDQELKQYLRDTESQSTVIEVHLTYYCT